MGPRQPVDPVPQGASHCQSKVPPLSNLKVAVTVTAPPVGATGIGKLRLIPGTVKVWATSCALTIVTALPSTNSLPVTVPDTLL